MKKIAVIFGGKSPEHDVSVITGVMTANALKEVYDVFPVYAQKSGEFIYDKSFFDLKNIVDKNFKKAKKVFFLPSDSNLYFLSGKKHISLGAVSCIVNCMHGGAGENGSLSGYFNIADIPTTSSPLVSSGVSMDKEFTKIFLKSIGVKTLPYKVFDGDYDKITKSLLYPVIVKPSSLGSSIGINKAENDRELKNAILEAKRYDDKIIIEKYAENKTEINCAVYKTEKGVFVSECEMPDSENKFLSFEDKYVLGKRLFPAPISKKLSDKIKSISKKVYLSLGFSGIIRIDYILCGGEVYLNEINSVPGSLSYYLFCETFSSFTEILQGVINAAIKEHNKKTTLITSFESDILKIGKGKGGKGFDKLKPIL